VNLLLLCLLPALDLQDVLDAARVPSVGVVAVHNGQVHFEGRGAVKANSLVRVGSISKVLAAEVFSQLVVEGKLGFGDTLEKFAPAGVKIPGGITLFSLATHTSGVPRNLNGPDLWRSLKTVDASKAQYSNAAFWFLGAAMGPYLPKLKQRITGPLGMADTTAQPSSEQCLRFVENAEARCGDQAGYASTASMYSTPEDMGRWLKHLLSDRSVASRIAHGLYVQRGSVAGVEGFDAVGKADGIGLGWVHLEGGRILSKTGAHDGFAAYIAFAPGGKTGVFGVLPVMDLEAQKRMAIAIHQWILKMEAE
jgi:serine-type D-Ala-D-Ala carboxypeptidase/endopeptidase